jgi:hypothetical protein
MLKRILSVFIFFVSSYPVVAQSLPTQQQKKPNTATKKTIHSKPVTTYHSSTKHKNAPVSTSLQSKLSGQWRGYFGSNGDIVATGTDNTEYVLELDIDGTKVSGYSYSYFQDRTYFVICSLSGTFDKAAKTLVVTETSRIKGITPPGWTDCLQMHTLTYKTEGTTEVLSGQWKMAPGQIGDCGFGNTTLTKRTLSKNLASYNKSENSTPFSAPKPVIKMPMLSNNHSKTKVQSPLVKNIPPNQIPVTEPVLPVNPVVKNAPENNAQPAPETQTDIPIVTDINYEKRNTNLLQTIKVENKTVRVDLYDNGVIDGDSISLFFNSKLILFHQRLSEKAITLTLNVNTNKAVNDLTMYAENLGEIPPNTALMVVTDGEKRYEVPVTSDLKNSGTVRFIYSGEK